MKLFEAVFYAAIIVCGYFAAQTDKRTPYPVDMCLVKSNPATGEDMTTSVWSDQVEKFKKKYPGSYCGKCGKERKCP